MTVLNSSIHKNSPQKGHVKLNDKSSRLPGKSEKRKHSFNAPSRSNYRLGILRKFLKRWDIRVPDLPFKLTSEESISTMQIRPREFMLDCEHRDGQKIDPVILDVFKRTIREQDLQIYVGIPTHSGSKAFYTGKHVYELLKPWAADGLLKLLLSYQGEEANNLTLWAENNDVEVVYLNKFSLVGNQDGRTVIGQREAGKTQNYLKLSRYLMERTRRQGYDPKDCLLVMVDDDYVMYSLETILMLIIPWVLGKARTDHPRLTRLCRKYRNLKLIKNGSTRLDPSTDELRQEVINGTRPVLNYKELIQWCLEKDMADYAIKLSRMGTEAQRNELVNQLGRTHHVIKEIQKLDPEILLSPYNLETVFGNKCSKVINRCMDRWMRIGGRVTTVVTKELARRPYKLPTTLSAFTYLLHGDDAIEFSALEDLFLAPGYGLEISKMIQAVLLTQKMAGKRPFKVANVINWPHIHIPNPDLPVLEMEMVIFFYLDFFISYIGLETLTHFQAKYEKKVEKVIRHKDGRIVKYPWHPRLLKGQYLVFPPIKDMAVSF